jgi:hypothetical protein
MKHALALAGIMLMLAGCTTDGTRPEPGFDYGPGIRPIPGSITYGGQPRSRLTKSPVGSSVPHTFRNNLGQRVDETYIIQPDRSLKLVSRRICRSPYCDN